ncbi:hypothetical protein VTK26DRAFT_7681 [Humicola hyalothermophila]
MQTMFEKHTQRVFKTLSDCFRHNATSSLSPTSFCRTKPNEYCQRQCNGCGEICELLRWGEVQRRRDNTFQGRSQSRIIHNSFLELDRCAGVSGCDTCRILRRAFLLEQITGQDAERLEHCKNQWPIYAVLGLGSLGDTRLLLSIRPSMFDEPLFTATVELSCRPQPLPRDPAGINRVRSDLGELSRVIQDCHHNHECSSKYRWSRRNPTWLLKILANNSVQLVEGPPHPVSYVVLSYSWGDPATMPAAEWARIKSAGTKTVNGRPVPERLNPFPAWDLPETMQDAIALSESLGFSYIWIDNVCIPKGTNWDTEASKMHEVYGNAAFTLVASSSSKATDHLLYDRLAWTHRNKACKLRGLWVRNTQMPLDQVRLQSPVALRAWTLQEERLSPRTLYWSSQRWYWSCSERQVAEFSDPESTTADNKTARSCPQRFLEVCRTGDEHQLHEEWLDIVEAYTRRDLVEPRDRFLAIAGLAVRFYNAKADTGGAMITEEYLAGLWRDNFARHLAWSVTTAVDPQHNLQHIAPSWSWASLPLQVHTKTRHAFKPSPHFKFIDVVHTEASRPASPTPQPVTGNPIANSLNLGQAVEERGRHVKAVQVQGRFRRFISEKAHEVAWKAIEWRRGERSSFDFGACPDQHIYARNPADGRIVSKDAHSGEVVGQLDYLVPSSNDPGDDPIAAAADQESESDSTITTTEPPSFFTPYVREGDEKHLVCLEIGESAMLLLMPTNRGGGGSADGEQGRLGQGQPEPEKYRRVGVAIGYDNRKGFFYGCETRRVILDGRREADRDSLGRRIR